MIDFLRSGGSFDFDQKELRLQEILEALNDPSVWEDLEKSQELNKERSRLEKEMNQISRCSWPGEDLSERWRCADRAFGTRT